MIGYIYSLILFFHLIVPVKLSIRNDIIQNGNKLSNDERILKFPITLGYVTPWNNKGYDIAKLAAKKFTHIVPVWFQIVPSSSAVCTIEGTHDIDHSWINEIKNNSPNTKILPRFLLDKWNKNLWISILQDDNLQRECGKILRNFVLRNDFDGVVLEVYLQSLMILQDYAITETIALIEMWSSMIREKELEVIIPLPPAYHFDQKNSKPGDIKLAFSNIYNSEQFKMIANTVDYVNIMTYDFHGEDNLESDVKEKILLGINYYGSIYNENGVTPILWRDFDKYMVDENSYSDIKWNEISLENFITARNKREIIYFPTKDSLSPRFKYVEENNLGGVAIWELGQGYNYFTELL